MAFQIYADHANTAPVYPGKFISACAPTAKVLLAVSRNMHCWLVWEIDMPLAKHHLTAVLPVLCI